MTERLLQFIWQFQYFNRQNLTTTSGQALQIAHPGQLNTNQGADFEQARICIDQTVWAGKIELHVYSSDWLKHGHQNDAGYNNIVLHVVWIHDRDIADAQGQHFATLEL